MHDPTKHQEELSAYLDGEARDPAALAAQLQREPALAQQLAQLQAIVEQVRHLPTPELRPEFVTRVMAQLRDEESTHAPRPWTTWLSLPRFASIGGFCVAALLLAVLWRGLIVPDAPSTNEVVLANTPSGTPANVAAALDAAGVDLESLLDEYLIADEEITATFEGEAIPEDAIDEMFLAMLDAAWAPDEEDELDTIDQLNREDQDLLLRLMQPRADLDAQNEG